MQPGQISVVSSPDLKPAVSGCLGPSAHPLTLAEDDSWSSLACHRLQLSPQALQLWLPDPSVDVSCFLQAFGNCWSTHPASSLHLTTKVEANLLEMKFALFVHFFDYHILRCLMEFLGCS